MMFWDKKRDATSVMSRRRVGDQDYGPASMKNESSKDEDGAIDGRHLAMQDFIAAHQEGSAEKAKEAMINFIDLHMAKRNEEMDEEAAGTPDSEADDY